MESNTIYPALFFKLLASFQCLTWNLQTELRKTTIVLVIYLLNDERKIK